MEERIHRRANEAGLFPVPEGENWLPLTGFSHGAAGMGLALLEVFGATGREEFRPGARNAFAYEDRLFDARKGNWPDFRKDDTHLETKYPVAWCHGAPGIALSRLRAMELDPAGSKSYLRDVRVGLEVTARSLQRATVRLDSHPCLCHGWAGWIDILLTADRVLNTEKYTSFSRDACLGLIEKSHFKKWQTGPSLMVGEAGIVYSLLRLHDPASLPPLLLAQL